jgi:outer membrane receptor for ferrienterochelin and colicin
MAANPAETVIVTGTRNIGTRMRESAAPVAVLSADALRETGASNLFDAMTALLPSYDSQSVSGDIGNMIRSVQLRGLGPNHVLVLVNGKRRHNTASIATMPVRTSIRRPPTSTSFPSRQSTTSKSCRMARPRSTARTRSQASSTSS